MKTVIKRRTAMVILAIVLALFTTFTLVLAQGLPGVQVLYALWNIYQNIFGGWSL